MNLDYFCWVIKNRLWLTKAEKHFPHFQNTGLYIFTESPKMSPFSVQWPPSFMAVELPLVEPVDLKIYKSCFLLFDLSTFPNFHCLIN